MALGQLVTHFWPLGSRRECSRAALSLLTLSETVTLIVASNESIIK